MSDNVSLGRSGLKVSQLGVGVMTWGEAKGMGRFTPAKLAYGGAEGYDEEKKAFEESLAAGVFLFDTAPMYSHGASEKRLGELSQNKNVVIATKFPMRISARAGDLPKALDESLARLGRKQIDLYMHHYPSRKVSIPHLMELMADAYESGKIKAIGVSNYSAEQMLEAQEVLLSRGITLASNEVEYSLLHRQPETNGVLEICRKYGISLIAYMPMASGALTGKYLDKTRPKGLFRPHMKYFKKNNRRLVSEVVTLLQKIGNHYSKSPGQVALRWLLENPLVIPIPGAKNGSQAKQNAQALSFKLTSDEIQEISEVTKAWRE